MAARLPLARLFDHLRHQDTHPPLDYLVRVPLPRSVMSAVALRIPSSCSRAAHSCSSPGDAGLAASRDSVTAVPPGARSRSTTVGEARMYALLELLGVAAGDRRRSDGSATMRPLVRVGGRVPSWRSRCSPRIGVPARRRHGRGRGARADRRAWVWRAAIGGAVTLWAVVWGTSFAPASQWRLVGWIPPTSPTSFATRCRVRSPDVEPLAWLVLAGVVAGGWCLWRADRRLAHVWLAVARGSVRSRRRHRGRSPFLIDRAIHGRVRGAAASRSGTRRGTSWLAGRCGPGGGDRVGRRGGDRDGHVPGEQALRQTSPSSISTLSCIPAT